MYLTLRRKRLMLQIRKPFNLDQVLAESKRENPCVELPANMNTVEAEWEMWVSRLHGNYQRASVADMSMIMEIVNRL